MKLLELHIHGFGKFHDCTLSFEDGINVIYGKNEAGKSTLHTFIRGMFFGIERQRGRASRNDLYSRFEPWENSGTYQGWIRLEHGGTVYRIERSFQKNNKECIIVNETLGKELQPTKALMDELLCGLSETSYNNTISIGQLKSATDAGMVSELRNYIANMNTSGSMELNITRATAFLKKQKKELESQLIPDAARSYTSLLGEVKNMEREISAPEYENQLASYQKLRSEARQTIAAKQKEKEALLQKVAKGRQVLAQNQFSDQDSIGDYLARTRQVYDEYTAARDYCSNKSQKAIRILSWILAALLGTGSGYLFYQGFPGHADLAQTLPVPALLAALGCVISAGFGITSLLSVKRHQKELTLSSQLLQETFSRHLGDTAITPEALTAFEQRMTEFQRLGLAMDKSEEAISVLAKEIDQLQDRQNSCTEVIEQQQKIQWELEKRLELLAAYKTQMEALQHTLAENKRISLEISAIDLALDTITGLSSSIRDSFGLYLNKTASQLISGITGGIYTSMSVDENLNVFMNTRTRLIPVDQVSSGTMDQVYLALRLAAAKLIQKEGESMPLIFDDSFVLYDEERLKTALKWLSAAYDGQILIFTCHQREAQMMTANQISYHLIQL